MTVRTCGCGKRVYELAAAAASGASGTVRLDTVDHDDGTWLPAPDGRTAAPLPDVDRASGRRGFRVHGCGRPLDGQTDLFGATP